VKISLYKTITYRILASIVTGITAYLLGLSLNWAAMLSIMELLVKPFVYFLHEEVWKKILSK
jgi:uncharacterized membrane protein